MAYIMHDIYKIKIHTAGIHTYTPGADLGILRGGGGGVLGRNSSRGGGKGPGPRDFHILTSKKNQKNGGGVVKPPNPPPPPWIRHCTPSIYVHVYCVSVAGVKARVVLIYGGPIGPVAQSRRHSNIWEHSTENYMSTLHQTFKDTFLYVTMYSNTCI